MAAALVKKIVYSIDDTGGKTFFRRCGVGFINSDGSINIRLDMFPTVKLQVRDENGNGKAKKPAPKRRR